MIKNLRPKLAEAGKIKIGGLGPVRKSARGATFRQPVKYDHFVITGTNRDAGGDLEIDRSLMDSLGTDTDGEIRAIPIVLHSDDIDAVFPTSYALYSGKKCVCRGDGETATRREIRNKEFTGNEKTVDCPCDYLNAIQGPKCKPNGKLYCSIAVAGSAVAGAVHIWRTTSIISIEQMIGSLRQIKSVCGTLRGIPLWLMIKPVTVEPPGSGPITVFCCHVELRAKDIEEIQSKALKSAETRRLLMASDEEYRKVLTTPGTGESNTEQAEIEAEFYAEDGVEDPNPRPTSDPAIPRDNPESQSSEGDDYHETVVVDDPPPDDLFGALK